jgi:hypothetical protein
VRARRGAITSAFFPSSSTGGISGTTFARFIARGNCQIIGDVARKVGGSSAWDSDIYSPDQYLNGCFVTFRADQTNLDLVIGLNSDPTTDQNYTGIDYAFNIANDGNAYIYESGVLILSAGAYTTSTVFTIAHDGKLIKYFKGGALVRQVPVTNATLFMDSSFYSPGVRISALQFGPLNAITPSPWVARGSCIAGVTTARKSGGSSAWDSDIYSIDSYPVCHVKFKPSQINAGLMIGLNSDPITDQGFASIDYAWHPNSDGLLYIYESGSQIGTNYGAYTTATELSITYDATSILYYKDRVLIRTVVDASEVFFADASFYNPGAAVNSLHFGPGTSLEAVSTPGIEPNAATDVYAATDAGPITISLVAPSAEEIDRVKWVTIAAFTDDTIEVTASYRVGVTGSNFTVRTAAIRRTSGGLMTFVPTIEKTTTAYEVQTVVGTFTQAAGTYDFGVGVEIDGDGSTNVDAIFRDINVRATAVKR